MHECVICHIDEGIALVTINRPQALNALNHEVLVQLYNIMTTLDENPHIKVVVLTGSGEKAFVAGADIAVMEKMDPVEAQSFSRMGQKTMAKVAGMRPFVIGAINGFALGGGCELAMACDMRVASERARMGIPEATLGVIPGFGGTQRLPRLVGLGAAMELLATGRQVKAGEAKEMGLVNQVTTPEELLPCCLELAKGIACNSTSAVSLGKQAMASGLEMTLDQGMELEASLFAVSFATPDQKEGMAAFIEKRPAAFQ